MSYLGITIPEEEHLLLGMKTSVNFPPQQVSRLTDRITTANMDLYYGNGRTYRYFNGSVQFPFGYGLSYSSFSYRNLTIEPTMAVACAVISISVTVTNTGTSSNCILIFQDRLMGMKWFKSI